jgi:hypothetical protein
VSDDHDLEDDRILRIRLGSGANCSSIGSVVDTLFATAAVGATIVAAVLAALKSEPVRVAGSRAKKPSRAGETDTEKP